MPEAETRTTLVGAVVGNFIVGDGTLVGPPIYSPAKPTILLKGKPFVTTVIAGDIKLVQPGKARMRLVGEDAQPGVSSTISPSPPMLTLAGKVIRLVLPTKVVMVKAQIVLEGRHYNRVTSYVMQPLKPKVILRGGAVGRVGKAGMLPTIPATIILTPSPAQDGLLVPTAAYTGLLMPTVEESV